MNLCMPIVYFSVAMVVDCVGCRKLYCCRLLHVCLTIVSTVREVAAQPLSADEYGEAPIVGTSEGPDGHSQVEHLELHCDEVAPSTSGERMQSIVTDHSPLRKLAVAATKTSPYDIVPLPHAPRREEGKRKRRSESSTILTSTPHKDYLNSQSAKKSKPPKKLVFSVQSVKKKKTKKTSRKNAKTSKKCQPGVQRPITSSSVDTTPCCICGKHFDEPPADSWTQCPQCTNWYHDSCGPDDTVVCYHCLA